MSYLTYLCLFVSGGVWHMLCCVCLWVVVSDTCCVCLWVVVSDTCCVVLCLFVSGGVWHVLCCVGCEWWCLTHVVLCLFVSGGVWHVLCCLWGGEGWRLRCTTIFQLYCGGLMKKWPYKTGDLLKEVQFTWILFIKGQDKWWPLNTGNCLIEVTACAGLTAFTIEFYSYLFS
jgi:hypothetical protein